MSASFVLLPLLVTIVFMLALRPLARGVGLIDKPGGRKRHEGEIPIIGGLAMLAGLLMGSLQYASVVAGAAYFLAAVCILVLVGAVDDRYDLPPAVRFLGQTCAVSLMIFGADIVVVDLGNVTFGEVVGLGWLAPIFTMLLVVTAINAFNMFDGSDGVAGGQALVALLFLGVVAFVSGANHAFPLLASLLGVVAGFLLFNWPASRTSDVRAFMGDAGSTMLGFTLAWVSIDLSQGAGRAISPIVVLWIFALPVFDLFSSMLRRVSAGRSPFHADSEHLHHLLKRFGLSSRQVAWVILALSVFLSSFGVGGYMLGIGDGLLFVTWLVAIAAYHVVFGSGLIIKRREAVRPETADNADTGSFAIWRQRR